jgi:DNA-binding LacI/PurR family transcriptional regulator
VRGIEDYVHEQGYAVLIAGSYEDPEREQSAIDLFRHKRVDGIIIAASSGGPAALNDHSPFRLPVVFVNNEHVEPGSSAETNLLAHEEMDRSCAYLVASDDVHGAALATNHLLQLGHQRIAYIGPGDRASSLQRLKGYRQALERSRFAVDDGLIAIVGEGANNGELAAFRLLARDPPPTALFCYDDMTALGALRAIRACQLRVPQDISVVGFDDIPLATYLDPPLTTVRQPTYEMGRQAARMLIGLLRSENPPRVVTMAGELVVRSSSSPAPP